MSPIESLLQKLWDGYVKLNPQALKIHNLLAARGDRIVNDHIAIRTFDHPKTGIDVLARSFLESGYTVGGDYHYLSWMKWDVRRHYLKCLFGAFWCRTYLAT